MAKASPFHSLMTTAFVRRVSDLCSSASIEDRLQDRLFLDSKIAEMRHRFCGDVTQCQYVALRLGTLLIQRYERFGDISFLEDSISILANALQMVPSSDAVCFALLADTIGTALCLRYIWYTRDSDILDAVSWHEQALEIRYQLAMDPWPSLQGRGEALYWYIRHYSLTQVEVRQFYIRKARYSLETATELCASHTAKRARTYSFLTLLLHKVGGRDPELCFRATALSCQTVTIAAGQVDPLILATYSLTEWMLVMAEESDTDLIQNLYNILCRLFCFASATYHSEAPAIALTIAKVERALGRMLHGASTRLSIHSLEHVKYANLLPFHHILTKDAVTQHSNKLIIRWLCTGEVLLLDEAITVLRQWLSETGAIQRSLWNNLATSLVDRFRVTNRIQDLTEAHALLIRCTAQEIKPSPGTLYYFANLADCCFELFKQSIDQIGYLNDSIRFADACLESLPLHYRDAMYDNAIAAILIDALCARFQITCAIGDLEKAIKVGSVTLERYSLQPQGQSTVHNSLANSYRMLGSYQKSVPLVELAMHHHELCLQTVEPVDTKLKVRYRTGVALDAAAKAMHSGGSQDTENAMRLFANASSGNEDPAQERFSAALEWIKAAICLKDEASLLQAYGVAIDLLPRTIYLGSELKPRVDALKQSPGLACRAALHAVRLGEPTKAIEWLELGRGVFWNRALQPRQSFNKLPEELLQKMQAICRVLEHNSPDEHMILKGQALTNDFDRLIEDVRSYPGMENFLRPESFSALRQASKSGLIVSFLGDRSGAYALAIPSPRASVICVPLQSCTGDIISSMLGSLTVAFGQARNEAARDNGSEERLTIKSRPRNGISRVLERLLAEIWHRITLPVLEALGPADRPRMWICSVGDFVSVPIHAAGIYDGAEQTCLADYCVPSYVSSIRSLLAAQTTPPPIISTNTVNEVQAIQDMAPTEINVSAMMGHTKTEDVAAHLEDTSVLHLACHGIQDRSNPLEAGFALGDEKLTVSKLMSLRMPKAAVAFLSACESAMGDRSLPDEAVHLAAAMSFVGFRSVVGTMWCVFLR